MKIKYSKHQTNKSHKKKYATGIRNHQGPSKIYVQIILLTSCIGFWIACVHKN
jgi:hypothetical protein